MKGIYFFKPFVISILHTKLLKKTATIQLQILAEMANSDSLTKSWQIWVPKNIFKNKFLLLRIF